MLQLTYISTVARGVAADACESILRVSRRRNLAAGVSGLLVFDGRRFLQALEGERDAVERTYARIAADPRHRAIVLLSSREVDRRDFGEWAMAAKRVDAADGATIEEVVDALTERVAHPDQRALFRSFARLRRVAA